LAGKNYNSIEKSNYGCSNEKYALIAFKIPSKSIK